MSWMVWAAVLLAQNFSSALMSRARMTSSLRLGKEAWWPVIGIGIFYVTFTVLGSVIAHYLSMTYIERRFDAKGK